jgi:hypothetical protein
VFCKRYQTMKKSTLVVLLTPVCASLLGACADSRQMTAATRGAEDCPALEGYPDCSSNGHKVDLRSASLSAHDANARDAQLQ